MSNILVYDDVLDLYTGSTTNGVRIGVAPSAILRAMSISVRLHEDITVALHADIWVYLLETSEDVVALSFVQSRGLKLRDALKEYGVAILEVEELVYRIEKYYSRNGKVKKYKVVISSEECVSLEYTYPNIAMMFACLQALEYANFQVFHGWVAAKPAFSKPIEEK